MESIDTETEVSDVETEVSDVETEVSDVETEVSDAETEVSDVETEVSDAETEVSDMSQRGYIVKTNRVETEVIDMSKFGYIVKIIHSDPYIKIFPYHYDPNKIVVIVNPPISVIFNNILEFNYEGTCMRIHDKDMKLISHEYKIILGFGEYDLAKQIAIEKKVTEMILSHYHLLSERLEKISGIGRCADGGIIYKNNDTIKSEENEIILCKMENDAHVIISGQKYMFDVLEIRDTIESEKNDAHDIISEQKNMSDVLEIRDTIE